MAQRKKTRGKARPFESDRPVGNDPPAVDTPEAEIGRDGVPVADEVLDEAEVRSVIRELLQSAVDYVDNEVSPTRALATKFYKGEPLGDEEEGRSQIVMTTVRDVVLSIMPGLLRTFFGSERAVEFVPSRPEMVAAAEQQSEYITHLFTDAPDALLQVQAFLKDGLVRRLGFLKWWDEEISATATQTFTGLTTEQVALLAKEEGTTYTILKTYAAPVDPLAAPSAAAPGAPPVPAPAPVPLHDCTITRVTKKHQPTWAAIPPEEIVWSRSARNFQGLKGEATLVAHRQDKRLGELVAMGFDKDEILEHAVGDEKLTLNAENIERQPRTTTLIDQEQTADESMWMVPFYEAYCRIDEDHDDIPELRKYYLCGEYHVLKPPRSANAPETTFLGVEVPEIPIAYWCPDPEPHTIEGQSVADLTMDLQRVDTALLRGQLDSLGLSLHPRVAYQVGSVNPHDILNTEVGAVIRTTAQPATALMEFSHSYVGQQAAPLVDYMKRVREERTGFNMESQGLNADALQSTNEKGIVATLSSAQARTELLARMAAEQGFIPLFKGLYRLVKQHQDYASVVRMRGKFVQIDPRTWDDDCEVRVSLMLGGGLPEQRVQSLAAIVAKQEFWFQMLGPVNPLVTLAQYSRANAKLAQLAGHPEAPGTYFNVITDEQAQAFAQQAQQAPAKPDPASIVAQAQAQNLQHEMQMREARLQLEQQKFAFDQQMEQEKLRQSYFLGIKQIEAQNQVRLNEVQGEQFIEGQKVALDAQGEAAKLQAKTAMETHKIETQAAVAREKHHLSAVADVTKAKIAAEATSPTDLSGSAA